MQKQNSLKYSVVIPVFNEESNVETLIKEIKVSMKKVAGEYEIIVVNDGSTDDTEKVLAKIESVKIISLRRNFGQSTALDAGIKASVGERIITLDGDGQNDPADFPKLIQKMEEGYDVVCGWRYQRKDSFGKRFVSNVARNLRSILVDDTVHDAGCTLRVYKRDCFEDLDLSGEMHRMIPAILRWRGFKITEIIVNHRPRIAGVSKYGPSRMVKGFLDMLLIWFTRKYNSRPLHLFGGIGLLLIFLSLLELILLAWLKIFNGYSLSDKIWPLVGMVGLLAGIQLFVSGILADLIIKNNTKKNSWMIRNVSKD